ncbi:phospholipase D family protein [Variovorax sp. J22G21]|uniref:phospholipase D family protein n=1 Tax=Variovorax fucosicus TaxID=3053517 RepID=UPI002576D8E7|nr:MULTISPECIES: phospholipase D family protein [unclassified Variovorax]MDM0042429.1 phospholipase D family protein [Variovorax sp. J22R193]MDM0054493.1 phospholipase D family protein [Variovorax sp. J22G47]MDM0061034.1 phospholipase D family protein [Variovorax sp. J22G21]
MLPLPRWIPALLAATLMMAAGCAQLPTNVERPVSSALASAAGTPFAALVQQRHDADKARFDSGFVLLDGPQAAYGSRLALVEGAQKTLDLQYYAIHADASTRRLMMAVREAAARGVRVRILIDDLHSTGRDALVLRLAYDKNIEVRLFNPLAGARGSSLARLFNSIDDASRIQQRMHNKLFLADNVLGVTGGRNLGDAYFGIGKSGNFVDIDVLAAGPVVQDLSRSFDSYWNNERAYPVQSLVTREELDAIRDKARAERDRQPSAETSAPAPTNESQRARVWDEKPLDLQTTALVWAPAVMLVDKPGKIAAPADEAAGAPGLVFTQPADAPRANGNNRRQTAFADAADTAAGGETLVEGLLQLIGQAQRDLLIISPYFVPGPDMKQAFASARARGVRVRVLTNSLASNDAPIAHVGYARHREALLQLGVELYEMRSEQAGISSAFGSSGAAVTGESRAMLHSKVLVMDGRLLVVGSMNLDLRSQLQNTEVALLIGSTALSRTATGVIETTLREGAWHVELVDGRLIWRAPQGSDLKDTTIEPDASIGLKLMLKLLGPLAPDSML